MTDSGPSSPLASGPTSPFNLSPDRSPPIVGTGSKWKSMFRIGGKPSRATLPTWPTGAEDQEVLNGDADKYRRPPAVAPLTYAMDSEHEYPRMNSEAVERSSGLSGVDKSHEYQRGRYQTPPTPSSHPDDDSAIHVPLTPVSDTARPRQLFTGSGGPPQSPRPYSSATSHSHSTSTTRSSDSSRAGPMASANQNYFGSSASHSRPIPSPAASFKGRFFSAPQSDAGSSTSIKPPKQSKSDRYRSLGKSSKVKHASGSSTSVATPRTPARETSQPTTASGLPTPPESSSATTRFLRRVVSAPNAKALFSAQLFASQPAMPPNASEAAAGAAATPSSKSSLVLPNHLSESTFSTPSEIEISESPPPLPRLTINSSPDPPGSKQIAATRSSRAHSTSQLGRDSLSNSSSGKLGPKQPFRRTYSSNSIKVKSVSDFARS